MDWVTLFDQYLVSLNIPILGVSAPSGGPGNDVRVDYADGVTQDQINQAESLKLNWQPAPLPDPTSFIGAITADTSIPAMARVDLVKYISALSVLLSDPVGMQTLWSEIKASDAAANQPLSGNCTDNVPVVTKVEAYAKTFNIPLTA